MNKDLHDNIYYVNYCIRKGFCDTMSACRKHPSISIPWGAS
jgi:hypothetical protein